MIGFLKNQSDSHPNSRLERNASCIYPFRTPSSQPSAPGVSSIPLFLDPDLSPRDIRVSFSVPSPPSLKDPLSVVILRSQPASCGRKGRSPRRSKGGPRGGSAARSTRAALAFPAAGRRGRGRGHGGIRDVWASTGG
jgi:hypothetical protein